MPVNLTPPGSKSETLRALVAAALADGTSRIDGALACDDSAALASSLERLGARILRGPRCEVVGTAGAFPAGPLELEAGESGAALRFLLALAATRAGVTTIAVRGRLGERPTGELTRALVALGAQVQRTRGGGYRIASSGLPGGALRLAGLRSSQTLSALLIAAPLMARGLELATTGPIPSGGYVELTVGMLRRFGVEIERRGETFLVPPGRYRPSDVRIEADWSSASYLLAAAAVLERALALAGMDTGSRQPDRRVLELLRTMGVSVRLDGSTVFSEGGIRAPLVADFEGSPDLAPTFAVLAALAPGTSVLTGLARLRDKESDRLAALASGLGAAGILVEAAAGGGSLRITGGRPREGSVLAGRGDHRLVMSFTLLALREPSIAVTDRAAVAKSYPGFFDDLRALAG